MTDSQPAPKRRLPLKSLLLPAGPHYPPMQTDEQLFESPDEKARLIAEYGITERQVRFLRGSALI